MIVPSNKNRAWQSFIHENVKSKRLRSHFLQDNFQKIERSTKIYIYIYIYIHISNILHAGYASHIPHGYMTFVPKDDLFYDFVKNYRKERYTQCGPVTVIYPDSPILVQPSEIYHRHVGMISNYLGHIPGAKYR
jgi:hypothetical protein